MCRSPHAALPVGQHHLLYRHRRLGCEPSGHDQVQNDITTLLLQRHSISDPTQADFNVYESGLDRLGRFERDRHVHHLARSCGAAYRSSSRIGIMT